MQKNTVVMNVCLHNEEVYGLNKRNSFAVCFHLHILHPPKTCICAEEILHNTLLVNETKQLLKTVKYTTFQYIQLLMNLV